MKRLVLVLAALATHLAGLALLLPDLMAPLLILAGGCFIGACNEAGWLDRDRQ